MRLPDGETLAPGPRTRPDPSPTPPRPRRHWLAVVAFLVLCAGATGGWLWWSRGAAKPPGESAAKPAAIPVEVAAVRTESLPLYLDGLGTVQAFNTVLVRSRVDGAITTIAFREGQEVAEGDVLATIDPRPYQAALDQALAKKAQDEATLAATRQDLERTRQLAQKAFATPQQLDQQTASVAAQEAQIRADQAAVDNARTQLDYTTIRSPLAGRTGLRLIDQGNIVRASDTTGIVEVAQIRPISVILTAPEGQLLAIAEAERAGPVEVTALRTDGRTALGTGRLALINNEVDAATGTVRLKATFANEGDRLWPGLSVATRLRLRVLTDATAVPEAAIQRGRDELFVFVVSEGDKAEKRTVRIGPFTQGRAVVEDGLKPGERVVVAGQSRLVSGAVVEVARPEAGDARPGGTDRPDAAAATRRDGR